MRIVITSLVLFAMSAAASAATTSYECKFSVEATPKGLSQQKLELRYVVDSGTDKAYLIGNAGSSEVKEIQNASGVSFVEITDSGNIMVTAISKSGDSVHSRNGIMFGHLVPSQYYGKCVKQ